MSVAPVITDPLILPSTPRQVDPSVRRYLDALEEELRTLQTEVSVLRRRDHTMHSHMRQLDEEMRLAARLQQDFLPKTLPKVGPLRFHAVYRPAGYVSGDTYDVMRLDEHHIGFFIADAVGHGMPAALLTMFLKRALITKEIHADGYHLKSPGEAIGQLNSALVEQNLSHATFATGLYGLINTDTLTLTFARGGHPNPILISPDGELRDLEADGGLLGIFPGETFDECTVQLAAGDRMMFYTDGIELAFTDAEAMNTEQWRSELYNRRRMETNELLADLVRHMEDTAGSLTPRDDLTIVILEVRKDGGRND